MGKSIKKNYLYNILLNISKVIFPLITAPYVARVLEPDGVGLFNFATTYASNFALFAALGIPLYGIREVAKCNTIEKRSIFTSEMISSSFFATLISSFFYFLSLLVIDQLNENYILFLISGLFLIATPLRLDWFYAGIEEFSYITFRSLFIKTLGIILLFLFVHEKKDLIIYVSINTFCLILNDLWNYVKLYKYGIRPRLTLKIKKHIKPLLLLFFSSVAISIYTMLDTLMLGFMSNYEQVGYYNSASHIARVMLPIVTSLSAVAIPRLSGYMKEENWDYINNLINKSLSVVSFLSVPITIGIIVIAPVFVPLFFGSEFYGAILPLQIMILVVFVIGLNNLTGQQILFSLGFENLFLYSVLSGTISNFVINLFLIPCYGAIGATMASVIAEICVLISTLIYIKKNIPIKFKGVLEIGWNILICVMFFPIEFFLSKWLNGWLLVFTFVIIGGIYYLLAQVILKNTSVLILKNALSTRFKH